MATKLILCAAALALTPLMLAPPAPLSPPAYAAFAAAPAFAPTRFSVVVEGTGPDVILIPGLASPREVWDGARAALGGRYRLHLVQLAGFGGTDAGPNATGAILEPTVAELERYIVANRLRSPAIVGHSMGGLMGLMLARSHPASVGRLMIVDSLPFIGLLFDPDATVATIRPQAEMMRNAMIAGAAGKPSRPRPPGPPIPYMSITPAGAATVARWSATADTPVAARAMYETMTTDLRPALPAIRVPMTMLYPYSAKSIDAERAKAVYTSAYRGAPNVRLVAVPESFHFIMLDQPAPFAAALRTFLSEKR